MKEAVIIKIAAENYKTASEAKAKMVEENPSYTFRGMRAEPKDGSWIAMFEKQAGPFGEDVKMDTSATPDVYGDSDELDVDAPVPSDDLDLDEGSDDMTSLLSEIRDVMADLRDAINGMNGEDHSEPDGDEGLGLEDLEDVSLDDEYSPDEVLDESSGKFASSPDAFTKKLYRDKEKGVTLKQARSELLREFKGYAIQNLEETETQFVATLSPRNRNKKKR